VDSDLERFVFVGFFICFSAWLILHEAVSAGYALEFAFGQQKSGQYFGRSVSVSSSF
jgi:hypothetical protein